MILCQERVNKAMSDSEDVEVQYFRSIKNIGETDWNTAAPKENLFLQYAYLEQLESFAPENIGFAYVLFCQDHKYIGVAYFQIGFFDAEKSIQTTNWLKKLIAKPIKFHSLIIGNALLTGEHGFYFSDTVNRNDQEKLLFRAIDKVEQRCNKEGRKTSFHLAKDFYEDKIYLTKKNYHAFPFSPNMILHLRPEWNNFDDYLDAMQSKYRIRVRRAEKKKAGLRCLEMDLQILEDQRDTMYNFYKKIADEADFNYTLIHREYFIEMKKRHEDSFRVFAYFDQNKMVGFYSTLHNFQELETGFIGFDNEYNASHQIYLNFLYDMVRIGLESRVAHITFARTALEIKSSIGAEPVAMFTYLKHRSPIVNYFLPYIVKMIAPAQEWQQRHPFK